MPPSVERNRRLEQISPRHRLLEWLDRELKALDPRLSLVRATEGAAWPLRPGFWHVRRDNFPLTDDTYIPITEPDGTYREPTADVLDWLRARDLWRADNMRAARETYDRDQAARDRAQADRTDERQDEMAGWIKAIGSPGVRVTRELPSARADNGKREP